MRKLAKYLALFVAGLLIIGVAWLSFRLIVENSVQDELKQKERENRALSEKALLNVVNKWRTENGKTEYLLDEKLCTIAKIRVYDIQKNWSHDGFTDAINLVLRNRTYDVGENLARDHPSEVETLNDWLKSEGHRENLEKDYLYTCIAIQGQYAVQIFGNF